MFERVTNRIGISITLFLVIAYLAWTNYKSLIFLTNSTQLEELLFCGVGALAFSMVTVMVMRNTRAKIALFTFPLFDVAFVFFGSNIHHAQMLADEPVRFWLSVVVALFTGVTIFSLSLIKAGDHLPDSRKTMSETDDSYLTLMRQYESLQTVCSVMESDKMILTTDRDKLRSERANINSDLLKYKSEAQTLQTKIDEYYPIYIRAEASRIRKKDKANYTDNDVGIIAEFDRLFPKPVNAN